MKYLRLILVSLALVGFSTFVLQADPVFANNATDDICEGLGGTVGDGCEADDAGPTVEGVISTVVNILSLIVGLTAVIMIIWGGFRYVSAGGDSSKISSARTTIIYAIVGLVIVAMAQFIVQFVVDRATSDPEEEDEAALIIAVR